MRTPAMITHSVAQTALAIMEHFESCYHLSQFKKGLVDDNTRRTGEANDEYRTNLHGSFEFRDRVIELAKTIEDFFEPNQDEEIDKLRDATDMHAWDFEIVPAIVDEIIRLYPDDWHIKIESKLISHAVGNIKARANLAKEEDAQPTEEPPSDVSQPIL